MKCLPSFINKPQACSKNRAIFYIFTKILFTNLFGLVLFCELKRIDHFGKSSD